MKITNEMVSAHLGINNGDYSRMLSGKLVVSRENVLKIANKLNWDESAVYKTDLNEINQFCKFRLSVKGK